MINKVNMNLTELFLQIFYQSITKIKSLWQKHRQRSDRKLNTHTWCHTQLTCQTPAPGRPSYRCGAAALHSDGWCRRRRWWRRWAAPPTCECWSPAGALDRPSLSVQPADRQKQTERRSAGESSRSHSGRSKHPHKRTNSGYFSRREIFSHNIWTKTRHKNQMLSMKSITMWFLSSVSTIRVR